MQKFQMKNISQRLNIAGNKIASFLCQQIEKIAKLKNKVCQSENLQKRTFESAPFPVDLA